MESDHNIYLGICCQNNDPEMRGRVKIYIPQLAPTIEKLNTNVDKFFNFIGKETNPQLNQVLEDLKNSLPWAEYAGPICGGNASGRYNAFLEKGTTSDSNGWENDKMVEGYRPAQNYVAEQSHPDAFKTVGEHKNRFANEYSYQYTPSNYSGFARGLFSLPNVGAHVYCFFINGDRNFPVYFASSYSQDDIKRIFTLEQDVNENSHMDYPATYENIKKDKIDSDVKTFRSKTVLNSNKHTIELIDTDLREILKLTHYSGSFKEFNNFATIELATNNDQKLVIGDQFLTVQHNKSEYIKAHSELIVGGDRYINVGETDQTIVKQILDIHKTIHDYKMLFNIQRAQYGETTIFGNPNDMSTLQQRKGFTGKKLGKEYKNGFIQCPICWNLKYNPYKPEPDGTRGVSYTNWLEPEVLVANCLAPFFMPACHTFAGSTPADPGNCIPKPHPFLKQKGYYRGMKCACCNGEGFSPSSQDGMFDTEPAKQKNGLMDQQILTQAPILFELERKLGKGGDEIKVVSMNKIETIGLVMNDLKSYRVDPIGKLKIDGVYVAPQGSYDNFKVSPHVEYVDVTDMPGDYILTAMNRYKLLVGSRGVNIQTSGPLDIYGTIVNFTGEQINLGSKNEIVVDGGERISLRARKISLVPVEHNAVVVEGQLHVTRNTVLEGGAMIDGELGICHITAPMEWHKTETAVFDIGTTGQCTTIPATYLNTGQLTIPHHYHFFQSLPMTLYQHPEAVREIMIVKGINSRQKVAAASVAANPSTACIGVNTSKIMPVFWKTAWHKAENLIKQREPSFDPIKEYQWYYHTPYYDSGTPDGQGPVRHTNTSCVTQGEGETIQTTVTMTFIYIYGNRTGTYTVVGIVDSQSNLISGPN